MTEIVTKGEFAARLGVARPTVSSWIRRHQLTAPAVFSDGRIDLVAGKQQLADRIDLAKSRGRAPTGLFANIDKPAPPTDVERSATTAPGHKRINDYAERSAQSRGDLLQLALDRKNLMKRVAQGQLVRAADFDRGLMAELTLLVATVDGQLGEWVVTIRGAASHDEARLALEALLDSLKERALR
jgi:hypothetical protein